MKPQPAIHLQKVCLFIITLKVTIHVWQRWSQSNLHWYDKSFPSFSNMSGLTGASSFVDKNMFLLLSLMTQPRLKACKCRYFEVFSPHSLSCLFVEGDLHITHEEWLAVLWRVSLPKCVLQNYDLKMMIGKFVVFDAPLYVHVILIFPTPCVEVTAALGWQSRICRWLNIIDPKELSGKTAWHRTRITAGDWHAQREGLIL